MERPFVFANLAMTLDGKIAGFDRADFPLGSKADRLEMDRLRAKADIVLWGGGTLRAARHPARVREKSLAEERLKRGLPPHPANGVVTKSGDVPPGLPWFEADEIERFIFVSPEGAARLDARQSARARVVVLDGEETPARRALARLREAGMKSVLIEGGGGLTWAFAGLIDEFHVTLTPWLAGGADAPTLMDGAGFRSGEFLGLTLMEARREGDELFLRYAAGGEGRGGVPASAAD